MTVKKVLMSGLILLVLAGCDRSQGIGKMLNLANTSSGPDEFAILPGLPLQDPDNYRDLPTPTPGSANLVDPKPEEDAVLALGGNMRATGMNSSEMALVAAARRLGVSDDIRAVLAREDEAFRRANQGRLLERLFNSNIYFSAYSDQSLDAEEELQRLRALGLRTPTAPPTN